MSDMILAVPVTYFIRRGYFFPWVLVAIWGGQLGPRSVASLN